MSFFGGRLRPYFQGIIRDSFQGDISSHLPLFVDWEKTFQKDSPKVGPSSYK